LSTLATSQQAATGLVNALQHVNREKESVTVNERVQLYLGRVKAERKKVVRYSECIEMKAKELMWPDDSVASHSPASQG
jgi:hypothetical protein